MKGESEAAQLCPTLSDPMDCNLPSSSHGIVQARVLEWLKGTRLGNLEASLGEEKGYFSPVLLGSPAGVLQH